ncbi:putative Checkpoint protein HUS1 [Hypsibius exemplaris]|uniref:Checkpoint protein n=1 Tax=Hypsibius exemplaris TaxID=2072580 RepID=A0A9X6NJ15_HYPEX|nr:putative Checkpoint protein HUS1 [Hypsibius exemplaris]
MCDIHSIQHLYKLLQTASKLTDQTCIIRMTPNRFYISTKPALMGGGWFLAVDIQPDAIFEEYQMSGYSEDANEIYLDVKAEILMQSLKVPSDCAKFVKIKLTNKNGHCMSVEAEMPSAAPSCRKTVFHVPITIVHRLQWPEYTPVDDVGFNASCYLSNSKGSILKVFKGVIDRMKSLGNTIEIAMNRDGDMKLHLGEPVSGFSVDSHFQNLEIPNDDDTKDSLEDRDEEEEEIHIRQGYFKVSVDIRSLAAFLGANQYQTTRMRLDLRHRRHIQMILQSEAVRVRYFLPSTDSQN